MWCVVKHKKYLKVLLQDAYEALKKQYLAEHEEPPEMLAGGFSTWDKADEKKQEIAVARMKEERETKARMKEQGVAEEVSDKSEQKGDSVDQADHVDTAGNGLVIPEIKEKVQPMLGAEFVMDDFMLAASGQHRGLPVFTGVQYAQSHPREAKMIAMLKYGVELSNDVIATIMGCSPQTVTAVCNLEEMKADVDGFKKLIKHRVRKLKLLLFTELEQDILDPDKLAEMDAFQKLALLSRIEEAEKSLGVGDGAGDGATPQGGAVQSKTISEERRKAAREELARMTKVVEVTDSATHAERA